MYIEELIIENFIANTFIILIYLSFIKIEIKKKKIIFLIIFMSIINVLIKLFCDNSNIITIFANITYIYFIENKIEIKKYLKRIIYYHITYYFFIGYVYFFVLIFDLNMSNMANRLILYLITFILIKFSIDVLWKMWITNIKYKDNVYNLKIEKIGNFKMLFDTGNFSSVNCEIPIIIMNTNKYINKLKKYPKKIQTKESISIYLKTINGKKEYKGYIFEDMILKKGEMENKKIKKAMILFTDDEIINNIFDGILPFDILIEK